MLAQAPTSPPTIEEVRENLRLLLYQEEERFGGCPATEAGEGCWLWTLYVEACTLAGLGGIQGPSPHLILIDQVV